VQLKIKLLIGAVAAVALVVVVVVVMNGHGSHSSSSANSADMTFVNEMIPHHQSAIAMAEIAQKRAEHPQLRSLAGVIITAQEAEIATLESVQSEIDSGGHEGMDMGSGHSGMSSQEMGMDGDVTSLETAKPFDKAFIAMMIAHHEGAVLMAREELANGELPELKTLAANIIKSQSAEIAEMRAWQKQWYGNAATTDGSSVTMEDHSSMSN
jgi:uncharacterized protein (DUF305 family)